MMKKIAVLVPLSILMAAAVWAFAAGDAGDPLVSLAYLNGTFTNMVETEVDQRLDAADAELLEDYRGHRLLVFSSLWAVDFTVRRNPGLELAETLQE